MSRSGDPRGCPVGRNCYVCTDHEVLRFKRRREAPPEDMAEAREWQAMSTWERETMLWDPRDYYGCDGTNLECPFCYPDGPPQVEPPAQPLRVPLGHCARMRAKHSSVRLIQAIFGALLACALVACDVPPAWMPGDPPLAIWADSDQTWANVEVGCRAWARVGLTCERVPTDGDATVIALARPLGDQFDGHASARFQTGEIDEWLGPEYGYFLQIDSDIVGTDHGGTVAAHELGHLMGLWGTHVAAPWALMAAMPLDLRGPEPSAEDYQALADAWGVAMDEW